MPAKLDRCVEEVKASGQSEEHAWPICVASTGLHPKRKKARKTKTVKAVFAIDIAKAGTGEGSRGGHVIGHTSSGKPIYASNHPSYKAGAFKEAHKDWTVAEHTEAANLHKKILLAAGWNSSVDSKWNRTVKPHEDAVADVKMAEFKANIPPAKHVTEFYRDAPKSTEHLQQFLAAGKSRRGTKTGAHIDLLEMAATRARETGKNAYITRKMINSVAARGVVQDQHPYRDHEFHVVKPDGSVKVFDIKAFADHKQKGGAITFGDLQEPIVKSGGEGSRGGHVIGHTKSGKPVYTDSHLRLTRGWSPQDHFDAADIHSDQLYYAQNGNRLVDVAAHKKARDFHNGRGYAKAYAERGYKKLDISGRLESVPIDSVFRKSGVAKSSTGEGSRGGRIIGHTKRGKPVYASHEAYKQKIRYGEQAADHPDFADWKAIDHSQAADLHRERARRGESDADSAWITEGGASATDHSKSDAAYAEAYAHGHAATVHSSLAKQLRTSRTEKSLLARYALGVRRCADGTIAVTKAGRGEGSRGGRIIGHTKSGKPIYGAQHPSYQSSAAFSAQHKDYSSEDHRNAAGTLYSHAHAWEDRAKKLEAQGASNAIDAWRQVGDYVNAASRHHQAASGQLGRRHALGR